MPELATSVPLTTQLPSRAKRIEYDAMRRRLWIMGQRCHHGATGAMLLTMGTTFMAMRGRLRMRHEAALLAAGTLLMAHDWKDRSIWFERGYGTQA